MFNFGGISHVIENPKGHADGYNYSIVGSVPLALMVPHKPTISDIMGGRVQDDGFAYSQPKWETVQQIVDAAAKCDYAKLCESPTCACRKLF